jgi:hypothetical protein
MTTTTKLSRGGRAERQETPPNQDLGRRRLQQMAAADGSTLPLFTQSEKTRARCPNTKL